jgi:hypothetical protein
LAQSSSTNALPAVAAAMSAAMAALYEGTWQSEAGLVRASDGVLGEELFAVGNVWLWFGRAP